MSWAFAVGVSTPTKQGLPEASYGWSHLRSFHRMLAAEERLDLSSMQGFGGTCSWQNVPTPLRLLFDLACLNSEHTTTEYHALADRLRAICVQWSTNGAADDQASLSMTAEQLHNLTSLVSVVDACIERGARLKVR